MTDVAASAAVTPIRLLPLGDAGGFACEGDSCAIPDAVHAASHAPGENT
ncbi:hypothetical protein [Compostimonas suwonensis]|uniref:Uncharacterized protein n=1 Tax=Compostimonas suwonensis TaxID=1048394 RepID=A0A2M9BZ33_9MICO|nr:hypothetical protein [Compostimonas suwonensis]PJJ63343.1 hypothetical protein CLV54_1008 [Compostimonas suwonensis]